MIDVERLCKGCMRSLKEGESICAFCGYDQTKNLKRSGNALPEYTILQGRYLLGRVLGDGGFGITYLAMDLQNEERVAIKEYFPVGLAGREPERETVSVITGIQESYYHEGLRKFAEEAQLLAQFQNLPGIVNARGFFYANETAYLVMDYIEGQSLKQYMADLANTGNGQFPLTYQQAIAIMSPVMSSLSEIHKAGLIHRDISPDNILIDAEGRVTLIDFGSAREDLGNELRSMTVMIKHGYAPEEQYRSHGKQGAWTDVYALSATLYQMISGIMPSDAVERLGSDKVVPLKNLTLAVPVPEEISDIIEKGMAIFGRNRWQSIDEMQRSLEAALEEEAKAKAEAEEKARTEAKVKAEAEARAKAEAKAREEAKAKAEAEVRAKAEAKASEEVKAKAETEARAKAEAKAREEARAKITVEENRSEEADRKINAEQRIKQKNRKKRVLLTLITIIAAAAVGIFCVFNVFFESDVTVRDAKQNYRALAALTDVSSEVKKAEPYIVYFSIENKSETLNRFRKGNQLTEPYGSVRGVYGALMVQNKDTLAAVLATPGKKYGAGFTLWYKGSTLSEPTEFEISSNRNENGYDVRTVMSSYEGISYLYFEQKAYDALRTSDAKSMSENEWESSEFEEGMYVVPVDLFHKKETAIAGRLGQQLNGILYQDDDVIEVVTSGETVRTCTIPFEYDGYIGVRFDEHGNSHGLCLIQKRQIAEDDYVMTVMPIDEWMGEIAANDLTWYLERK